MSALLAALNRLEGRVEQSSRPWVKPSPMATDTPQPVVEMEPAAAPAIPEQTATPEPAAATQSESSFHAAEAPPAASDLDAFAARLLDGVPPPALLAFLSIGIETSLTPTLRAAAEAVVRRLGRDVVLLGPGLLDDPEALGRHWSAMQNRAAYGFLHAPAEYAAGRLEGLEQVTAVIPVVELGRSSARALMRLRDVLATRHIALAASAIYVET